MPIRQLLWLLTVVLPWTSSETVYMEPGDSIDVKAIAFEDKTLRIFCYKGNRFSMLRLFETLDLELEIDKNEFVEYGGRTEDEVLDNYKKKLPQIRLTLLKKRKSVQLSPFEQSCVALVTKEPYRIALKQVRLDMGRVAKFVLGISIFRNAHKLSRNSSFYYLATIVLNSCTVAFLSLVRTVVLLPMCPVKFVKRASLWLFSFYFVTHYFNNMRFIILIIFIGIMSILRTSQYRPVRKPALLFIIKFLLHAAAGTLVCSSTWHSIVAIKSFFHSI
ncbi:uncharacterized protein LOC115634251 [Scaptodrosophila lebanonensis]|uniref:Uncharacterized protein LOC115634251 n=1 Tax=Drosophila lebanonensis TaxID=7225 RepID=A0A6J2UHT8_DROLE|nr:uncharacterized protein LOC115634251 [Scaptodrosophila lebanonensis]